MTKNVAWENYLTGMQTCVTFKTKLMKHIYSFVSIFSFVLNFVLSSVLIFVLLEYTRKE